MQQFGGIVRRVFRVDYRRVDRVVYQQLLDRADVLAQEFLSTPGFTRYGVQ